MMNCVKKIIQVSFIGLMVLTLASCGNQQTSSSHSSGYDSSISKGLNAVADNKYDKALTYFDNALTQKPNDKKAQAYHDQTQAYLKTPTQLDTGEVQRAVRTITDGTKITNGAKSLDTKLSDLKKTAKSDLVEYRQLKGDVADQLKVTDDSYDTGILKQCQVINWRKQPYLKKLKPDVDKLLKQAGKSSSSGSSSSSSAATKTVSAADKKEAEQMRATILQSDPGKWDKAALAQVPDEVILAAMKKSNEMGGDPGTTAHTIADQYPNIKKDSTSDEDDSSTDVADKAYLNADEAKQQLGVLDFYKDNQNEIQITGQTKGNDAWKFSFKKGDMTGTILVENKGIISASSSDGEDLGMNTWR